MNANQISRKQLRKSVSIVRVMLSIVALLAWLAPVGAQDLDGLRIVVLEGEDSVNIIAQGTAVPTLVEVRDRNDLPVAGASVSFLLQAGGTATLNAGLSQVALTTNALGQAAVTLNPLVSGVVNLSVSATFAGETATAVIVQTNFATLAEAAAAGAGATGGGAGTGGAGAGAGGGGGGASAGAAAAVAGTGAAVVQVARRGGLLGGGPERHPPRTVTLSVNRDSVMEGRTAEVTVTAELSRPWGGETTVALELSPVTADSSDYDATWLRKSITIPAEKTMGTARVTIIAWADADESEDPETIEVVGKASGGIDVTNKPTVEIRNDAAPTVTLELNPKMVGEDDGEVDVTVTVHLSNKLSVPLMVDLDLESPRGTAVPREKNGREDWDYEWDWRSGPRITIEAGSMMESAVLRITPRRDAVREPDETIVVSGEARGVDVDVTPNTLLLLDGGLPTVTLTLEPKTVREDAGEVDATVTAHLSSKLDVPLVLDLEPPRGTAVPREKNGREDWDYEWDWRSGPRITIEAGSMMESAVLRITPRRDAVKEPDETIVVSGKSDGDLDVTPDTLSLLDGELPTVTLMLEPKTVREDTGEVDVTVTAHLSSKLDLPLVVSLDLESPRGTAVPRDRAAREENGREDWDYEWDWRSGPRITIEAGSMMESAVLRILPRRDGVKEPDETIVVSGEADVDVDVTPDTLLLLDGELPTVTLMLEPRTVREDAGEVEVTVTAHVSSILNVPLVVDLDLESPRGTAVPREENGREDWDYEWDWRSGPRITIEAGAMMESAVLRITPRRDGVKEPDETIVVSGEANVDVDVTPDTLLLLDGELPTVTLMLEPRTVREDAGEVEVTVTAHVSSILNVPLVVDLDLESPRGTAVPREENGREDWDYEWDWRSGPRITIEAGSMMESAVLRISPRRDSVREPDETIVVSGEAEVDVDVTPATLFLLDSELPTALRLEAVAGPSQRDSDYRWFDISFSLAAVLSQAVTEEIAVELEQSATLAPENYMVLFGENRIEIPLGDDRGTTHLAIRLINLEEGLALWCEALHEERFRWTARASGLNEAWLELVVVCHYQEGRPTISYRFSTDALDGTARSSAAQVPPDVVGFSIADADAEENVNDTIDFTVTLDRVWRATVSVDYTTADGSAQAGSDYIANSGTVTFSPGERSKTVHVSILDDTHDEGEETFTLVLSNASGGVIVDGQATGRIKNQDPLPRALLARFGRTAAVQVVEQVEERLEAPRHPGVEGRFAGRALRPGMERDLAGSLLGRAAGPWGAASGLGAAAGPMVGRMASLGPSNGPIGGGRLLDGTGIGSLTGPGVGQMDVGGGGGPLDMGGGDLLTGSAFSVNQKTRQGGVLSFWSRGAQSSFMGREGALALEGDVRTTMFGADYAKGPVVMGLSLANSRGLGNYAGVDGGRVATSVTGLYPWVGYRVTDRVRVWGVTGYGAGGMMLTPGVGPSLESGLSMAMAAGGARGELIGGGSGGFGLAFKADALWVGTNVDGVDGPSGRLAATETGVTRFRTGLEGSREFLWAGRISLRPSAEVGLRHDGGDAETGAGVDVGGGLIVADSSTGLALDVRMRMLVVHQADGFRERGMALSLSYDPTPSTPLGFMARVAPSWGGEATGGAEALWGRETMGGLGHGGFASGSRLDAEIGYGLPVGSRFVGAPRVGFAASDYGRDYRMGYGLTLLARETLDFELGVDARRRENPMQGGADAGFLGRATVGW